MTERQIQLLIPDQRSPIRRAVILRRVDPELRIAQFYSLMIERDLFGTIMLVRSWGRIGTRGSELALSSSVFVGGRCYRLAYAELPPCDQGKVLRIQPPTGYFYFIQAVQGRHGTFLFSPQNATAFYVSDTDPDDRTAMTIGLDRWVHNGRVVGPHGEEDLLKHEPSKR